MAPGAAVAERVAPATTTGQYLDAPVEKVFASKTNPRTHFDDSYINELAGSIVDKGLLQPIIVRPKGMAGVYEIVAGECRWRATKRAGLPTISAIVRDYTDEQVLELQLIENIHRQDLTPLEQAVGYRKLIQTNPDKHSAATIAARIGMSEAWVWDRLKLNDLIPEAKTLLEQDRISTGHAILIARQKAEDQKRIVKVDDQSFDGSRSGLWRQENGLEFDEADEGRKADQYDGFKTVSVRELKAWIRDHIRFDVQHAAKAQPLTFEETAQKVAGAEAMPGKGKKVVAITYAYRCPDAAKVDERTFGSDAWKRADGQEKSRTCESSVMGLVVAGEEHYGEAFLVCVARDKCETHWGGVIREKRKTAKLRESGQTSKAEKREAAAAAKEEREKAERERKDRRWKAFLPALQKAVFAAANGLKTVNGPLYEQALRANQLPASTKPADLPRVLLLEALRGAFDYPWLGDEPKLVAWAKLLKVDVKALEPKTDDEQPATGSAAKKASATKKR